jgi:hypothetical protein
MTPDLMLITESYGHLPDCRRSFARWNSCQESVWLNWQSQEFWYMF